LLSYDSLAVMLTMGRNWGRFAGAVDSTVAAGAADSMVAELVLDCAWLGATVADRNTSNPMDTTIPV